jgi:hypothetical protein
VAPRRPDSVSVPSCANDWKSSGQRDSAAAPCTRYRVITGTAALITAHLRCMRACMHECAHHGYNARPDAQRVRADDVREHAGICGHDAPNQGIQTLAHASHVSVDHRCERHPICAQEGVALAPHGCEGLRPLLDGSGRQQLHGQLEHTQPPQGATRHRRNAGTMAAHSTQTRRRRRRRPAARRCLGAGGWWPQHPHLRAHIRTRARGPSPSSPVDCLMCHHQWLVIKGGSPYEAGPEGGALSLVAKNRLPEYEKILLQNLLATHTSTRRRLQSADTATESARQ